MLYWRSPTRVSGMTDTPKPCGHPGCNAMGTVLLPGDVDDQWLCRPHLNELVREKLEAVQYGDGLQNFRGHGG